MNKEPGATPLGGLRVLLGVSGGIAAYKTAELVRLLKTTGAAVQVVMTEAAQAFVTPLLLQTLSGQRVATSLWDATQEAEIGHIALADQADVLLVAPATADLLAKLSLGLAGDLLTTVALACKAPLWLCPAMNVHMWEKTVVAEHVARLTARGAHILGPASGDLACGHVGPGRMVEPADIVSALIAHFSKSAPGPLQHRHVVVTAGPTFEPIDPVRFIGNRSSGKMGFALAEVAAQLGARVSLVAGPVSLPTPPGVTRFDVETAAQMAELLLPWVLQATPPDCIVMAAAVADFRPAHVSETKYKKQSLGPSPTVPLVENPDILRTLSQTRRGPLPLLVGFAAETHDTESYAAAKLAEKGCEVMVANDVSRPHTGFGSDKNQVTLFVAQKDGPPTVQRLPLMPKRQVAEHIFRAILPRLPERA